MHSGKTVFENFRTSTAKNSDLLEDLHGDLQLKAVLHGANCMTRLYDSYSVLKSLDTNLKR